MLLDLTDLSSESLQSQIINQVRARILSGHLNRTSPLPSIRALARSHRISVITVQRAYEERVRQGLILSRRGQGYVVSELSEKSKRKMARQRLADDLRAPIEAAMAEGLSRSEIRDAADALLSRR